MSNNRNLASRIAVAVAAVAVVGASAFADSRHANETATNRERGGAIRRDRGSEPSVQRRSDSSVNRERRSESRVERRSDDRTRSTTRRRDGQSGTTVEVVRPRTEDRSRGTVDRNRGTQDRSRGTYDRDRGTQDRNRGTYDRNRGSQDRNRGTYDRNRGSQDRNRGTYDRNRGSQDRNRGRYDRNRGNDRNRGSYGRGRGDRYHAHGRVSRVHPYNGGYRVWIVGSPYPFFVPHAYYHHDRFRVGLSIRLGGYYNPLGYYDYYDYNDRYVRSGGELRGTVESVDYRRDTFVIRNEATGNFVTVVMRDRRPDGIRPGDFVELYGDWSRYGVFTAYDVERLDY